MFYSADKSNVHGVGGVTLRQAIPRRDRLWIFYPKLLQLNLLLSVTSIPPLFETCLHA